MRLAVAVTCVLALATGCGTLAPGDVGDRRPATDGRWQPQRLTAEAGADAPLVLTAAEDDVLVMTTSEEGAVRSNLSAAGEAFEAGPTVETGLTYARLAGAVRHEDGWFALANGGLGEVAGEDELLHETRALLSDDGLTWTTGEVTGFAGPADVTALVESDGVLVAGGAYREERDPAMGGFRPMVWRSEDGLTWTESTLPDVADDGESSVLALAVVDGTLLAAGSTGGHGMLWSSEDAGRTWRASEDPAVLASYAVRSIAAERGVVVVSTERRRGAPRLLRSSDGGSTFAQVAGQPVSGTLEGAPPLWSGGGRFFTLTSRFIEAFREPEICYADIVLCQQDSSVMLHASDDGETWSRVDTSGIGTGESGEVDQAVATEDGRVITTQWDGAAVEVHTWPAGVELPGSAVPVDPAVELTPVPKDGVLVPGVRYHAPLFVHCGMDWLYLGDRAWRRTDAGPDLETGAGDPLDPDWPVAQQTIFGFATLTDDGLVEYSIGHSSGKTEVIATYAKPGERPPGCD